jgi:signal transduction histidine kinase
VAVARGEDIPLRRFEKGQLTDYLLQDGKPLRGIHYIYSISAGTKGTLWLATTQGLGRLRDGRYALEYGDGGVYSAYEDRTGTVWLATQTGLVRSRDGKSMAFTRAQGVPCDWLTGLTEDDGGYLWMMCSQGVVRVQRRALDDVAEGRTKSVVADTYGQSDGLRALDSARTTPPNVIRDGSGRLWFVGPKGPSIADPSALPVNDVAPPVAIESVLADRQPVRNGDALPPGRSTFELQYTALSFRAPSRVEFQYKLEGLDRSWVDAGTRRIAYYSRIPPGSYRFRVKARNDSGVWNEEGASISFSLAPHFYQTAVFRVAVVLALGFGVWLLLRFRVRRSVQQVEDRFNTILAERNRMAHEFHDTFEQSLIGIKLQLEAAATVPSGSEASGHHLRRAYDLTLQSVSEAHHSIWALRSGILEYQELEPALWALARQVSAERAVACRVEAEGEPVPLPQDAKDQVLRIAQEAITNAVRHGRPANVVVVLTYEKDAVRLRVRDDGTGFDVAEGPSRNGGRFGLLGMRERAQRLGGQLTVNSRTGEGTTVELELPNILRRS